MKYGFANEMFSEIYNLTIDGFPEYFTWMLWVGIAKETSNLLSKNVLNSKQVKKIRE